MWGKVRRWWRRERHTILLPPSGTFTVRHSAVIVVDGRAYLKLIVDDPGNMPPVAEFFMRPAETYVWQKRRLQAEKGGPCETCRYADDYCDIADAATEFYDLQRRDMDMAEFGCRAWEAKT